MLCAEPPAEDPPHLDTTLVVVGCPDPTSLSGVSPPDFQGALESKQV